ncbi:MAG: DUF4056 domain-containing protein [Prolixibacteraceae bacterium]|nr:DUF4056 domain-containing protein [Prolixibacteraceae bacterium]
MIRTCCAFGDDVGLVAIPFVKVSDIIAKETIGEHEYLGGKNEGNGIIYTYKGGFIDLGHLRDQSDWTAYLHQLILQNKGNEKFEIVLGRECGLKSLQIQIPKNISNKDAALLAGRIAFDLSVWHEIATWYGASSVPFVPERYSSFSVEDDYSNQLGIQLGIASILSDEPFSEAMTKLLDQKLKELEIAQTIDESFNAMELVNGRWWSQEYKIPNKHFLLKHEIACYTTTYPKLVLDITNEDQTPIPVEIAMHTNENASLVDYYTLTFKTNHKFPFAKIFKSRKKKRIITNSDFFVILEHIRKETKLLKYRKLKRKNKRKELL